MYGCYRLRYMTVPLSLGRLSIAKRDNDQLRPVIDADRDNAVAQAPADDHFCLIFFIDALGIFWEESLIRRHKASHKGQAHLPAMGVAA